jgi:hypothetical protein
MNSALRAPKPATADLLEKHVSRQVRDFLEARGWRILRNGCTKFRDYSGRWTQIGEVGAPDFLALKYLDKSRGVAVALWIELKRSTRGRLSEDQAKWRDAETRLGAIVLRVDDVDDFMRLYDQRFAWIHTEGWSDAGHQTRMLFEETA